MQVVRIAANTYTVPTVSVTTKEDIYLTQIIVESIFYLKAGSKMFDVLVSFSIAVLCRAFIPAVLGMFWPF